jgi:hypothetical protein
MKKIEVLDVDLGKHLEHHDGHGFVLSEANDSVYFSYDDAIKIVKFIADRPKVDYATIMVKGDIEQDIFKKWVKD